MKRWVQEKLQQKNKSCSEPTRRPRQKSAGETESGVKNKKYQNGSENKNQKLTNTSPSRNRRNTNEKNSNSKNNFKRNLFGETNAADSSAVLAKNLAESSRNHRGGYIFLT